MPVKLSNPIVKPALSYENVHLCSLHITLEETEYARGVVQALIRLYAIDENGKKVFSEAPPEFIEITDAEQFATELYLNGDMSGIDAMNHVKSLVALLVQTKSTFGNASII